MIKKTGLLFSLFAVIFRLVWSLNSDLATHTRSDQLVLGHQTLPEINNYNDYPYLFSALPAFDEQIKTSIKTADARPEIIRQYLQKYESPLVPHADLIVELSDQYDFDYRWLVAIAQQESNLCKKIPENSYNCWGWGIYPDPKNPEVLKVTRFDNYDDALRRIAPQFTKIFLKGKHYKDPLEVMKTYTPPSDGSWAFGVSQFFDHLE